MIQKNIWDCLGYKYALIKVKENIYVKYVRYFFLLNRNTIIWNSFYEMNISTNENVTYYIHFFLNDL